MRRNLLIAFGVVCLCLAQTASMPFQNEYLQERRNVNPKDEPYCTGSIKLELNDAEKKEFVQAHNDARRREEATNMLQLVWDEEIASIAQYKANTCEFFHSMHTDCSEGALGQNLYTNFPISGPKRYRPINYTVVTFNWADERDDWDWATQTCRVGKKCGHWLAVTGAKTRKIGCGKAECRKMAIKGVTHEYVNFIVCNYGPFSTGFQRGSRCSNCGNSTAEVEDKGYTCENELCVPCDPKKNSECNCGPKYPCRNGGQYSTATCGCKCPREYYGTYCERPCRCLDLNRRLCQHWASECTNKLHKYWLLDTCQDTCNACSQFKRPASCNVQ